MHDQDAQNRSRAASRKLRRTGVTVNTFSGPRSEGVTDFIATLARKKSYAGAV